MAPLVAHALADCFTLATGSCYRSLAPCRLLQRSDWFTQEKACRLLAAILGARPDKAGSKAPSSGAGSSSGAPVSAAAEGVHATQVGHCPFRNRTFRILRCAGTPVWGTQALVRPRGIAPLSRHQLKIALQTVGCRQDDVWRPMACQVAFVEWLCAQLRRPSHQTRAPAAACNALGTLLREPSCRQLFTRAGEAHR